jgi:hypothetical protein
MFPNDNDDLERLLLKRTPRFQAKLDRSRRSIKEGEGLSGGGFLGRLCGNERENERQHSRQTVPPNAENRAEETSLRNEDAIRDFKTRSSARKKWISPIMEWATVFGLIPFPIRAGPDSGPKPRRDELLP